MSSRAEQKREAREARERAEREAAAQEAHRRRTAYLAGGIALIALVVVVALVLVSQSGSDSSSSSSVDPNATFAGVPQAGFTAGDPKAPVTVVEFADLQCPFCRDFAVNDLPGIVDDYVKPGKVLLELRLLAFLGSDSETGRQVAFGAAQQDLMWPFAENVYAHQGTENTGYMTEDFLKQQADGVDGLDSAKALAAIGSPQAAKYASESDSEAQAAGVNSTPTFVVKPTSGGGQPQVVNASGLRDAIDKALAETGG
jgi:protein-disulfide isomerase